MPLPFARSLRAVQADRFSGPGAALVTAAVVLAAWVAWALVARVGVYVRSSSARLEVGRRAHPVQPVVSGRVARNLMALGREVEEGEILVELDATGARLELLEASAKLAALGPQIAARRQEIQAQRGASSADTERGPLALAEARARVAEANAATRQARDVLVRTRALHDKGVIGEAELVRAQADVDRATSAASALRLAVGRTAREGTVTTGERLAHVEDIQRELAALEGETMTATAAIQRLEHEISVRAIRASVAGRLAEVGPAPPGTVLAPGDHLGAIVPRGDVSLAADFDPADALGRVRPGQSARFRLDGFPWTQYGALRARVERVGGELRDGKVRVELSLLDDGGGRVPIEHGLPGSVEIQVEDATPAALVMRAAGWLVDRAP